MLKSVYIRIMTLPIKLHDIIHAGKISAKKTNFNKINLKFLLEPLALKPIKTKYHLIL
jgi:hypothetical protein